MSESLEELMKRMDAEFQYDKIVPSNLVYILHEYLEWRKDRESK